MAYSPKAAKHAMKSHLLHFANRAWETFIALFLLFSGLWDTFGRNVFPPEVEHDMDHEVFRVYGIYLSVGAIFILVAIFNPCKLWARRIERTGMLLAAVTMTTMAWLVESNEEVYETPQFERVEHYFLYGLVAGAIASFARYWYLGKQREADKIVHLIRKEVKVERRRRSDDVEGNQP